MGNKFSFAKDAEIIVGDKVQKEFVGLTTKGKQKQAEAKAREEKAWFEKRCKTDNGNSYATESILRTNFEKEWKTNPGCRAEIIRKYMKKG